MGNICVASDEEKMKPRQSFRPRRRLITGSENEGGDVQAADDQRGSGNSSESRVHDSDVGGPSISPRSSPFADAAAANRGKRRERLEMRLAKYQQPSYEVSMKLNQSTHVLFVATDIADDDGEDDEDGADASAVSGCEHNTRASGENNCRVDAIVDGPPCNAEHYEVPVPRLMGSPEEAEMLPHRVREDSDVSKDPSTERATSAASTPTNRGRTVYLPMGAADGKIQELKARRNKKKSLMD